MSNITRKTKRTALVNLPSSAKCPKCDTRIKRAIPHPTIKGALMAGCRGCGEQYKLTPAPNPPKQTVEEAQTAWADNMLEEAQAAAIKDLESAAPLGEMLH